MSDEGSALADEDVLVLPAALRRHLHPRRGGSPGVGVRLDRSAAARTRALAREAWPDAATLPAVIDAEARWRDGAVRHLAGEDDPAGAAGLALATWARPRAAVEVEHDHRVWPDDDHQCTLVDAWVGERGAAFAACALVELSTLLAEVPGGPGSRFRLLDGASLHLGRKAAKRMRTLLAAASEEVYQEAVERLGAHRRDAPREVVVSYLVPTELGWIDDRAVHEDWAATWWLRRHTVSTPAHLAGKNPLDFYDGIASVAVTLADAAGVHALPLLVDAVDTERFRPADTRRLLDVIAVIPADAAFQALVDRRGDDDAMAALLTAMTRFPARALRLLAASGASGLLADHTRAHPELASPVPPGEALVPDAAPGDLPRVLVEPPWTLRREAGEPVVIDGLVPPAGTVLGWIPGEREAWSAYQRPYWADRFPPDTDWADAIERERSERRFSIDLAVRGPEALIRPLLAGGTGDAVWEIDHAPSLKCLVGRYELDAVALAVTAARRNPAGFARMLLPCLNAEIAGLMAEWLARRATVRQAALAWFGRHGGGAARMLVPAALGRGGEPRRQAEGALRLIADQAGAKEVVEAAREFGDAAAAAIGAMLDADPLHLLPSRVPAPPAWANPGMLPQILLRGRERALPLSATAHVITMLALSKPGEVYAGVEIVRATCNHRSLAEFAWALFERWERCGGAARDGWALDQLGWLGDDETARCLAERVRVWPGAGGHAKAVRGLDALAAIGTDMALMRLNALTQRLRFKGLKTRAKDKIEEIAAHRGLTPERLADRLVPDFGLDPDGTMTLDYGPRRFTVGFDQGLTPLVIDEDGGRRRTLPRPSASDDPDLAPAAYQRFSSMKQVAKKTSADQLRRLESAMVQRRRWSAPEFHDLFVRHPLVWHIARRLVWLTDDGTAFRIAEDRGFADVHDAAFTLPGAASLGIAHPAELGGALAAWRQVLDDYELLQPFPQLDRPTYAITGDELRERRIARFDGSEVVVRRAYALLRRGWARTDAEGLSRDLGDGCRLVADLDPGLVGGPEEHRGQRLTGVRLTSSTRPADPVLVSEALTDLGSLIP
ncbi:DUF4132 domain-containing protein [Spirillospora sp. CA-294931]|uniref:DUF4132 domain-containing protein n=1 Tax=Spirillospora sp. CA-294931 TaxID=3240042 RepID=UPI003D8E297B